MIRARLFPNLRAISIAALVLFTAAIPSFAQQNAAKSSADSSDPVLQAMREEIERSKSKIKMDNVPPPFYIEYRLSDVEAYEAEAAFGALRQSQRAHTRVVRVVVRVGDYKQDSYYGGGMGVAEIAPLDDNILALRRQLWLATDLAYKNASEALASKKAVLSQFTSGQPFDDFSHSTATEAIEPLARLDFDAKIWEAALEKATAQYRTDPRIQNLTATVRFHAQNQYFVNTEGTVTRQGRCVYYAAMSGSTQATDGMRLDRSPYYSAGKASELPTPEKFVSDTAAMLATLKALREAPEVEEEYRGPVLFSNDAASDVFNGMIGGNVLGRKPKLGDSARVEGEFASSYKSRVLPTFLTIVDDPTLKSFDNKTLIGGYDIDDEGVRAAKVAVVQDGILVNYLLGREPIRDFPDSNGHGRAGPGQPPVPSIGNLIVQPKQPLSADDMKMKLSDICREEGKAYG
jgi:TldD protein